MSQTDPARTVQIFIDLVQRHEQAFYAFVHKVHTKGEGLFNSLMQWIEIFLSLVRDGLGNGENISLEFLLPHTGQEREDIIKEVDAVALYHYKLKVAYEDKVRRRFGRTQGFNDADAADEMTATLLEGVVQEVSFGDLVKGEADDLAAEEDDDEDDDSSEEWSGSEGDSGSEDGSEDEDDSDDSDESNDSEDSDDGASTERDNTPHISQAPLPPSPPYRTSRLPQRSHTSNNHSRHGTSQSVQIPPARPSIRIARSMTFSGPSTPQPLPPLPTGAKDLPLSPLEKPLPAIPGNSLNRRSQSQGRRSRERPPQPPSPRKHKRHAALKPPELQHLPRLLPLFVEMVRDFCAR